MKACRVELMKRQYATNMYQTLLHETLRQEAQFQKQIRHRLLIRTFTALKSSNQ